MAKKFELGLSSNYVPSWTLVDAVRELFQNALDQETVNAENKAFYSYDPETLTLTIGNRNTSLDFQSLLLGASTKANDPNTIGKFGEGYKVATLVLTRLDKVVTIHTKTQVWYARFVDSRRFKAKVLTFFFNEVDQLYTDLTFYVTGITPEEYQLVVDSILALQDVGEVIETRMGRILVEDKYRGKIFVSGLYVCSFEDYGCGYDFKPAHIRLDRDRKLVSDFDTKWLASSMWNTVVNLQAGKIVELAKRGTADVSYLASTKSTYGSTTASDLACVDFRTTYGPNAIPVTAQYEMDEANEKYVDARPIIVSETVKHLVTTSDNYKLPEEQKLKELTLSERLDSWFEHISDNTGSVGKVYIIEQEDKEEFFNIVAQLKEESK